MNQKVIAFNKSQRAKNENLASLPDLRAGDVIKIHRRIKEGNKSRIQMFQGTIIALSGGQSSSPTMTVRKVSSGVGVELILPLNSPQIEKIEFVKRSRVRRSKIYFIRDKSVKVLSRKLKEVALSPGVLKAMEAKGKKVEIASEEPEVTEEEVVSEETPVVEGEGEEKSA